MVKIIKFGEVLVKDSDVVVRNFSFDCSHEKGSSGNIIVMGAVKVAVEEAIKKLEKECRKL